MSDFNPYLKWLGIRDTSQPINHYRLLGLDPFESDREVISMAADRQMAHVRTYQSGPQGELSQKLLGELARARRCLLTPEQKTKYDQQLKERTSDAPAAVAEVAPFVSAVESAPAAPQLNVDADPSLRSRQRKNEKSQAIWGIVSWISGGLAAVGVSAYLISAGIIPMGGGNDPEEDVVAKKSQTPIAKVTPDTSPSKAIVVDKPNKRPNKRPRRNKKRPKKDIKKQIGPGIPNAIVDDNRPLPVVPVVKKKSDFKSTQWNLKNVSTYPRPTLEIGKQLQQIDRESEGVLSEFSGMANGQKLRRDIPRPSGVLIGFRVWLNDSIEVSALQPVYNTRRGLIVGRKFGDDLGEPIDVFAKPGTAVSAVRISVDAPVTSIQLEFKQLTDAKFVRDSSYESERIGQSEGRVVQVQPLGDGPAIGCTIAFGDGTIAAVKLNSPRNWGRRSDSVAGNQQKLDVPTDLANYRRLFAERYSTDLSRIARTQDPAQAANAIQSFARRLLRDGEREPDDQYKYLILESSMNYYSSIGDIRGAIRALEKINSAYQVNYWSKVRDQLSTCWKMLSQYAPQGSMASFSQSVGELVVEAKNEQQYDTAIAIVDDAIRSFARSNNLKKRYRLLKEDIEDQQKLAKGQEKAKIKLKDDPEDANAHQAMGDYFFFHQDDLSMALSHWLKSNKSKTLVRLAKLEDEFGTSLDNNAEIEKMAKAWERLGKGYLTRHVKARRRAIEIYEALVTNAGVVASKQKKLRAKLDMLRKSVQ